MLIIYQQPPSFVNLFLICAIYFQYKLTNVEQKNQPPLLPNKRLFGKSGQLRPVFFWLYKLRKQSILTKIETLLKQDRLFHQSDWIKNLKEEQGRCEYWQEGSRVIRSCLSLKKLKKKNLHKIFDATDYLWHFFLQNGLSCCSGKTYHIGVKSCMAIFL